MLKQCYTEPGTTINPKWASVSNVTAAISLAAANMEALDQGDLNPTSEHTDQTGYVVQGPAAHIYTATWLWVPACCARSASLPDPWSQFYPPSHILALSPHSGLC